MAAERNDTEVELLWATGRALGDHGVASVTTQNIADEWGRAQSLVHYYYDTKEDLVVAYVDFLRERRQVEYAERADDPPLDRVEWMVAGGLGAAPDDTANVNALYDLHGEAPHNERYQRALDGFEEDARVFLADAIRDGVEDGTFRPVDPEAAALFLLSASDGVLLRTVSLARTADGPLFRQGATQYLRDVLLTEDASEVWDGFRRADA